MSQSGDLAPDRDDRDDLIRRLGSAVMSCWSDLPEDVQETLLSRTKAAGDADDLDARLRLFVGARLRRLDDDGRA